MSNYYCKIKLILLEKGINFKEEVVAPSQDVTVLNRSPLGKIPFIEIEHGNLSETQVILEYLEEMYPDQPLYPADIYQRAKCREFIHHLELNIELNARQLYKESFFGGVVPEETKKQVKELLERGFKGLSRLAKFSPYVCGDIFTAADSAAWVHFFVVGLATKKIYGSDMVAEYFPNVNEYMQLIETRPCVQKVASDRAASLAQFLIE